MATTPNYFGTLLGLANPMTTATTLMKFADDVVNPNVDVIPGVSSPVSNPRTKLDPNGWTSVSHPPSVQGVMDVRGQAPGAYTGSGAGASYDPNTLAQFDQSENMINSALGRLDGQLGIARSNIDKQYGVQNNELDSSRAANENNYKTSSTQNSQNLRSNKNVISDQASNGLRGLLRTLGAFGAGGSSDSRVAGQAVADQASQQRAGAGQVFSQNQQGLDTNWNNFLSEFDNSKRKLNDWRDEQMRSAESQSLTSRQDLLGKLAEIRGNRAALLGGSYTGSAQPYLDQANALNGRIDELGRINPSYSGTTPVYQQQALDTYDTGAGTASTVSNVQDGTNPLNTPYLSLLLGKNKTKSPLGF